MSDPILPGTLDVMILRTLARGAALHGFEIAGAIAQLSDAVFAVEEGSLYPALQRMLVKGWVTASWGATREKRRARYYAITDAGREQLARELARFERVVRATSRVLRAT